MKLALVLDSYTFKIKDTLQYTSESFQTDMDYSNKSTITVDHEPNIEDNDFVICKEDNEIVFIGMCVDSSSSSKNSTYTVKLAQKECLFDRQIFVKHEELLATGLEDFVKQTIEDNWTNSGDSLMDYTNIDVVCDTHTPCDASVSTTVNTEQGIYNFKTFLGNCLEYYRLILEYDFVDGALTIHLRTDDTSTLDVDVTVSDVSEYVETYNVKVLARLYVRWKIPDSGTLGGECVGAIVDRAFYLRTDRTITQNKNDPNRAAGISRAMYIETESEEDMIQNALNEFASNSYQHKVSFSILKSSKIYPMDDLYIGRPCRFKTKLGIKTSKINSVKKAAGSNLVALSFGTLKVTLIEKVRGSL